MKQDSLWDEKHLKRCSGCGEQEPLEAFNRRTTAADGRQWNCRDCNRAWHEEHKAHHNRMIHARTARVREEHATKILAFLLNNPCVDCGENDPVVLEFDHLHDKVDAVSYLATSGSSWATIQAEIAKCEVVCANCHRRRTARRARTFRYRSTRLLARRPGEIS